MITVLKHRLAIVLGHEHPLLVRAHAWRRAVMRTDQRLRREYLRAATEPKLQIGGGWCQKPSPFVSVRTRMSWWFTVM